MFIKSFVNPFVDITLNFLVSSFYSFLFDVKSFSLLPKSVFLTSLAIKRLLAKFVRFNLKVKNYAVNLRNSGVVIYLS